MRPPSPAEHRAIVAVTRWTYAYESSVIPYRPSRIGVRLRFPRLRAFVVRIRVARSDPRFAAAVVELRDVRGRRQPGTQVVLYRRNGGYRPTARLVRWNPPWDYFDATGTTFPRACTPATPKAVRELACPNPWAALGYPRPRVRLNTAVRMRLSSPNVHAVDWRDVVVPGAVCGATGPIRMRPHLRFGEAFVRSVEHSWWPAVAVSTGWNTVRYGDLDGDGRDEAALDVVCSNGGGTASGQLAFATVIYEARGGWLRSLGIVRPRQPFGLEVSHVPSVSGEIRRGKVIAHEFWSGPRDGTCCSSGRATTVWSYADGRLRAGRTVISRPVKR